MFNIDIYVYENNESNRKGYKEGNCSGRLNLIDPHGDRMKPN